LTEPDFLEADVVLFLRNHALREYGGVQGVKDDGLRQSALGRPVNKLGYAGPARSTSLISRRRMPTASPAITPSTMPTSARLGAAAPSS
jgi:hypothetical protein